MIDWKDQENRPITTRNGQDVLILGIVKEKFVGAVINSNISQGFVEYSWFINGSFNFHGVQSVLDLLQAPKRVEHHYYANLYLGVGNTRPICAYASKQDAIDFSVAYEHRAIAIPTTITIEGDKVIIHGEGKVNNEGEKVC